MRYYIIEGSRRCVDSHRVWGPYATLAGSRALADGPPWEQPPWHVVVRARGLDGTETLRPVDLESLVSQRLIEPVDAGVRLT